MRPVASSVVELWPRPGALPVGALQLFKTRPPTAMTTPIGAFARLDRRTPRP